MSTPRATRAFCDFETRSAAPLRKTGSWRYSLDPTTEILCLAFRLPDWKAGRTSLWHPAFPHLDIPEADNNDDVQELLEWISDSGLIEAHNAWFERGIWTNILVTQYGWPAVPTDQWRCSAAKAAAHALPRGLGDACSVLRLPIAKDAEGHTLMKKVSKPRKARKAEKAAGVSGLLWWESQELFERLWDYCRTDVLAEEALSDAIPDLTPAETEMYLLDQTINQRGFQLDDEAVDIALALIKQETVILTKELVKVTNGQVAKATQRAQMLRWFASEGLDLEDTQKATLDEVALDTTLSPKVKRGVELVRTLGRSSTAKYQSMANWRCPDGRVRGGLLYHGAGTGRWSGAGVQPHNFVKGSESRMGLLWDVLRTRNRDTIRLVCGDVMEALANGLRGAIVAAPGFQLYVADYAAIEARVVLWLAGDEDALGIFRRHEDIYKDMAADIYSIPMGDVSSDQRQHGKQAVLGCGYQMGWSKFQATCAKYGILIDDATAQRIVEAYRAKYWRVVEMWSTQEHAAMMAVRTGKPHRAGYVTWLIDGKFLYCELPSGRRLSYPFPEIRERETPWGAKRSALTFMGINAYTRKWERQSTYGGSLVENITQAVARDLMAEAMLRCEKSDTYRPVLSVHDELIAEAKVGTGSVAEFEALMAECPVWAEGCPVEAAGWTGERYRK